MPRGIQKSDEEKLQSIEEQIAEMEERKAKIQSTITKLNNQRKKLLQTIHNKKLVELSKVLDSVGKTPEDIIEMLNN